LVLVIPAENHKQSTMAIIKFNGKYTKESELWQHYKQLT
jgi:hypothetical protein